MDQFLGNCTYAVEEIKKEKDKQVKYMKFRKKPVVVEAVQFHCERMSKDERGCDGPARTDELGVDHLLLEHGIRTLEGFMRVKNGDWIITGVRGEKYACRQDIFEETYETAYPAVKNSPTTPMKNEAEIMLSGGHTSGRLSPLLMDFYLRCRAGESVVYSTPEGNIYSAKAFKNSLASQLSILREKIKNEKGFYVTKSEECGTDSIKVLTEEKVLSLIEHTEQEINK